MEVRNAVNGCFAGLSERTIHNIIRSLKTNIEHIIRLNGGNHYKIKCTYDNQFFEAIRGVPKDGKNWNDSGTLPDTPAVGYVEIPQIWPGFDNDPEHEYPVGGDIGGHGRVVQRVIQRPTEVAGAATNAGATNATSSTSRSTTTITTSAINSQVSGSNRRVTGVRGSDREFWEWLESVSSEDEWGEE